MTATPDLVISVRLDNYPYGSADSYELRLLSLNVYRADGQTLIWRGRRQAPSTPTRRPVT